MRLFIFLSISLNSGLCAGWFCSSPSCVPSGVLRSERCSRSCLKHDVPSPAHKTVSSLHTRTSNVIISFLIVDVLLNTASCVLPSGSLLRPCVSCTYVSIYWKDLNSCLYFPLVDAKKIMRRVVSVDCCRRSRVHE